MKWKGWIPRYPTYGWDVSSLQMWGTPKIWGMMGDETMKPWRLADHGKTCLGRSITEKKKIMMNHDVFKTGWWWLEPWNFEWLSRNSWEFHHPNWLSYFSEGWLNHQPVHVSRWYLLVIKYGKLHVQMSFLNLYILAQPTQSWSIIPYRSIAFEILQIHLKFS